MTFDDYAFISLGSNLPSGKGDSLHTLQFAMLELVKLSDMPVRTSSIYSSAPVDSPPGTPDFLNAVVGLVPGNAETALSLLQKLQVIENAAGRKRSGTRNEARTLDLDLITFRNDTRETPELVLPHPRAHERRFVLEPLMEITGSNFKLPGNTKSIGDLLQNIPSQQAARKI